MSEQTRELHFLDDFLTSTPVGDGETIVQRLYEAFKSEVVAQRWSPGDMVPDAKHVADRLGVSRASVSRAYSQLAKEGFLRRTRRKGSEFLTPYPDTQEESLCIGVVLCSPLDANLYRSEFYANELAAACINQLKLSGHTTELAIIGADAMQQGTGVASSTLFTLKPQGILALGPAPHVADEQNEDLPVIYLHRSAQNLNPRVMADTREGVRMLTNAAIGQGHRSIVLLGDPSNPTESAIRWLYHAECMAANGLPGLEEAFRESMRFNHQHLGAWKDFLESHPEATCYISAHRVSAAQSVASAALLAGKSIPLDISLLSFGRCSVPGARDDIEVASVDIDLRKLIKLAIDALASRIRGLETEPVSFTMSPRFFAGASLAAPSAGAVHA